MRYSYESADSIIFRFIRSWKSCKVLEFVVAFSKTVILEHLLVVQVPEIPGNRKMHAFKLLKSSSQFERPNQSQFSCRSLLRRRANSLETSALESLC